jgi:cytochrome bd-type quinol oxidase subunit 2
MANSKRMAGLIGPALVVLGASEAKNHRIWQTNSAPVVYLNGLLLFVGGLSIVRAHNLWTRSWPVMVTLVGWFAMVLGLFRMLAPEAQQAHQNAPVTITTASVISALGLFLTSKAGSEQDG